MHSDPPSPQPPSPEPWFRSGAGTLKRPTPATSRTCLQKNARLSGEMATDPVLARSGSSAWIDEREWAPTCLPNENPATKAAIGTTPESREGSDGHLCPSGVARAGAGGGRLSSCTRVENEALISHPCSMDVSTRGRSCWRSAGAGPECTPTPGRFATFSRAQGVDWGVHSLRATSCKAPRLPLTPPALRTRPGSAANVGIRVFDQRIDVNGDQFREEENRGVRDEIQ